MCLLVILREVVSEWPLVVAANRDEWYDRPSEPPTVLSDSPLVFGGRDLKAGGTWLAVNQRGMVSAVTNRTDGEPPSPDLRSRGLLCLDAATQPSTIAVADLVGREVSENFYAGFNLVCVSPTSGCAFYFNGGLREKPLGRGAFIFTTGDANDLASPKVERTLEILGVGNPKSIEEWVHHLETICRDHSGTAGGQETLCTHADTRGTVSSTILAFHESDPDQNIFRHAAGKPCKKRYEYVDWPAEFFSPSSLTAAPYSA